MSSGARDPRDAGEGDRLPELAARVAGLSGAPVGEHPDVLEAVHRGLVGELDALAAASGGDRQRR